MQVELTHRECQFIIGMLADDYETMVEIAKIINHKPTITCAVKVYLAEEKELLDKFVKARRKEVNEHFDDEEMKSNIGWVINELCRNNIRGNKQCKSN